MKCTKCGGYATVRVPRHNAAFCNEHYVEHIRRQVDRTIREFRMFSPEDSVLVAVSGGKDSMALWHILDALGYTVHAVHLNSGFETFSAESAETVRAYATAHDLSYHEILVQDQVGFSFEEAGTHSGKSPCALCGTIKRYVLNGVARDAGVAALATGHNLDDEAAFLMNNVLNWQMGYLERQSPLLPAEAGMARRTKPLVRVTDEETARYCELVGIEPTRGRCPYATDVTSHFYKDMLHEMENHAEGIKAAFYLGFLRRLQPMLAERRDARELEPHVCPECGYKTMNPGRCFVCSLRAKVANSTD
jgi:tRNA-5-methyluridine54 2-sulfurtransferase